MQKPKSTADKLLSMKKAQQDAQEKYQEELEQLKRCANKIFSTREGKFWAKRAFADLRVNNRDSAVFNNIALMAAEKALRDFYLKKFKELLDPEVLINIERGQ